jgi:hypothetical protein
MRSKKKNSTARPRNGGWRSWMQRWIRIRMLPSSVFFAPAVKPDRGRGRPPTSALSNSAVWKLPICGRFRTRHRFGASSAGACDSGHRV